MKRGRIEAPPITDEHVAAAKRLFQKQPHWPSYQVLGQQCRVPRARWWRFVEILSQRGIAMPDGAAGVVAISGRVAGRTFEEFLGHGGVASQETWDAWRSSADPRPAEPQAEEKRYG